MYLRHLIACLAGLRIIYSSSIRKPMIHLKRPNQIIKFMSPVSVGVIGGTLLGNLIESPLSPSQAMEDASAVDLAPVTTDSAIAYFGSMRFLFLFLIINKEKHIIILFLLYL